jgi:hypothetical protein
MQNEQTPSARLECQKQNNLAVNSSAWEKKRKITRKKETQQQPFLVNTTIS